MLTAYHSDIEVIERLTQRDDDSSDVDSVIQQVVRHTHVYPSSVGLEVIPRPVTIPSRAVYTITREAAWVIDGDRCYMVVWHNLYNHISNSVAKC